MLRYVASGMLALSFCAHAAVTRDSMDAAKVDYRYINYPGAVHAFQSKAEAANFFRAVFK